MCLTHDESLCVSPDSLAYLQNFTTKLLIRFTQKVWSGAVKDENVCLSSHVSLTARSRLSSTRLTHKTHYKTRWSQETPPPRGGGLNIHMWETRNFGCESWGSKFEPQNSHDTLIYLSRCVHRHRDTRTWRLSLVHIGFFPKMFRFFFQIHVRRFSDRHCRPWFGEQNVF